MTQEFIADTDLDDYEYLQNQSYYHEAPSDVLFQEYLRDLYLEPTYILNP